MSSWIKPESETLREILSRKWKEMSALDLEDHITRVRRAATTQHLTESQWMTVDRMRERLALIRRDPLNPKNGASRQEKEPVRPCPLPKPKFVPSSPSPSSSAPPSSEPESTPLSLL